MTIGGLAAGMLVALASAFVARSTALKEDASLAAFYLISLALGVLIVSTRGGNVDLMHVLFGTVLALNDAALVLLCSIATTTLTVLAILFRPLVLECVDPIFLRSVSRLSAYAHLTFLTLVVLNLVAGFHALGTLMAVGIMILPAAAGRFWTSRIERLIPATAFPRVRRSFWPPALPMVCRCSWGPRADCCRRQSRGVILKLKRKVS
jgi:zinc/manganese transport system permease protein